MDVPDVLSFPYKFANFLNNFGFLGKNLVFLAFYARKVHKKMVYIREHWMDV